MELFLRNISLAIDGVSANKFRAFLTALGIVFGVAAVISMVAIGKGAQKAIIEQLEQIGTNNILLTAITPEEQEKNEEEHDEQTARKKFSPGLNMQDVESIQAILTPLQDISPELHIKERVTFRGASGPGACVGVWNDYFRIFNLSLEAGSFFSNYHLEHALPVCLIGSDIYKKYFKNVNALGKSIKVGRQWFSVIGILDPKSMGAIGETASASRNFNNLIFIPVTTAIQRLENRSRIDKSDLGRRRGRSGAARNYHQLDRVVLKVGNSDVLRSSATLAQRIIKRRHNDVEDVAFDIPELLIKQRQQTQQTLNFVLGIIAGISLLVGGIGIMNIMLASVLERIKEIGIRRSVGAGQQDIIFQFLLEATLISLFGGIVGVFLGIGAAKIIAGYADIETTVDAWAILLSFGVAVSVGLFFGFLPARKAAQQDPVKALRSD